MKIFSTITIVLIFTVATINAQTSGTLTDKRDGKVYKTAKIGKQTWMAENLAFKTEKGCLPYNNDIKNVIEYGYLYNFETAKDGCPSGWHLPSREEFEKLIKHLGGEEDAAYNLKSAEGWEYKGVNYGINCCGFNALQKGIHYSDDDSFYNEVTVFWSNTTEGAEEVWFLSLYIEFYNAEIESGEPTFEAYVRCLKD